MLVDQNTKISKIIEGNQAAIEQIAGINKHFKKLKNPILRKVLGTRVSVKDAAKIGGVSINEFLQKLAEIGMQVEFPDGDKNIVDPQMPADGFELNDEMIVKLDVRPTIESGADPFSEIMAVIKTLKSDQILQIINIFEPIPLINILKNKGFESFTKQIEKSEFHTFFRRIDEKTIIDSNTSLNNIFDDFDSKMVDFGSNLVEIDVRELEMPEPMVAILNEITNLPYNHGLFVHHKKVPQFLLPELKSRSFSWLAKEIEEGYVQMLIWKQ
jgi:uncharacterized protein (DUF2249 family)